jgi:hypothetical protein
MLLLKNYFNFFKLSLLSLALSLLILNISLNFLDRENAIKLTLIFLFTFNFLRLKNYYKFKNNHKFFFYLISIQLVSRIIEYHLFLIFFNLLNSDNISWLITISFTHFLKFFSIEIFRKFNIKINS